MDRVHSQAERSITDVQYAAVAIQAVDADQRHIGVVHREGGQVNLLHLAWHHDLRNHPPGLSYCWVEPNVPPPRMRQVAAICRKVWRANDQALPYAFSEPSDCFDTHSGAFLLGPSRHGLTCASFVLAIFETAGLPLVRYDTWPSERPGDREWQEWVISQLANSKPPAEPEHMMAITSEIGSVRFRPEDVAAAATISPLPADFKTSSMRSLALLKRLP